MRSTPADINLHFLEKSIVDSINHPEQMEDLYRRHSAAFEKIFNGIYPQIRENPAAQIWNQRFNYQQARPSYRENGDIIFVIVAALVSGMVANIPNLIGVEMDFFLQRNIGFVVFPMLIVFFGMKQKLQFRQLMIPLVLTVSAAVYINLLPHNGKRDAVDLACLHLPVFLWALLGYSFIGGRLKDQNRKVDFLRFNGDFIVMTAVIVLAGGVFTAITIGLYEIIGLHIAQIYTEYVLVWGLSAVPIVSTYLVYTNPQLVNRVSPTIARIFTPIVFVSLFIFLSVMLINGKNIYQDREFLLIFNMLLVAVMAIVLFSVTEATAKSFQNFNLFMLFGLALLTVILNGLALSAIAFRLAGYGITPNRVAVLGANVLMFVNLILVANQLFLLIRGKSTVAHTQHVIALFMPLYGFWTAFVTFVLPLLFGFS